MIYFYDLNSFRQAYNIKDNYNRKKQKQTYRNYVNGLYIETISVLIGMNLEILHRNNTFMI